MIEANQRPVKYDLEERTFTFAQNVRAFFKLLTRTIANNEDGKQVIRSSGSVGTNYIEANESLGKKDFLMRIRISRKEAKESGFWLRLLDVNNNTELEEKRQPLVQESTELMLILGKILQNSELKQTTIS